MKRKSGVHFNCGPRSHVDFCNCDFDDDRDRKRHDFDDDFDFDRRRRLRETILKCGMGMSPGPLCGIIGGIDRDHDIEFDRTFPVIASVTIDTRHLKDITLKIDFSSLISFKTRGDDNFFLRLKFRLSRICDDEGRRVPLGTWTFDQIQKDEDGKLSKDHCDEFIQNTESFCFTFCQDEARRGRCTYVVELVDEDCFNIEFATITNIFITAIANGIRRERSDKFDKFDKF